MLRPQHELLEQTAAVQTVHEAKTVLAEIKGFQFGKLSRPATHLPDAVVAEVG